MRIVVDTQQFYGRVLVRVTGGSWEMPSGKDELLWKEEEAVDILDRECRLVQHAVAYGSGVLSVADTPPDRLAAFLPSTNCTCAVEEAIHDLEITDEEILASRPDFRNHDCVKMQSTK